MFVSFFSVLTSSLCCIVFRKCYNMETMYGINKFILIVCVSDIAAWLHQNDLKKNLKWSLKNAVYAALVRLFESANETIKFECVTLAWHGHATIQICNLIHLSFGLCVRLLLLLLFEMPNILSCAHIMRHQFRLLRFVFCSFYLRIHTHIRTPKLVNQTNEHKKVLY